MSKVKMQLMSIEKGREEAKESGFPVPDDDLALFDSRTFLHATLIVIILGNLYYDPLMTGSMTCRF